MKKLTHSSKIITAFVLLLIVIAIFTIPKYVFIQNNLIEISTPDSDDKYVLYASKYLVSIEEINNMKYLSITFVPKSVNWLLPDSQMPEGYYEIFLVLDDDKLDQAFFHEMGMSETSFFTEMLGEVYLSDGGNLSIDLTSDYLLDRNMRIHIDSMNINDALEQNVKDKLDTLLSF